MTLLKCGFMFFVVLTICLASCVNKEAERESMIDKIVKTIETCPAWTQLKEDDVENRNKIMASMKELSKYDLDLLREAIKRYVSRPENELNLDANSCFFVLHRYIFDVPAVEVPVGSFRSGWGWLFGDSTGVTAVWPLSVDAEGNLVLTGSFHGYSGEEFQPLTGFDYFKKNFGVRREPGNVRQPN